MTINPADFMIRFLLCNVLISGIIGILLTVKRIFRNSLSGHMQYRLWFLLLGLLAVPFVPLRPIGFLQIFSWFCGPYGFSASGTETGAQETFGIRLHETADRMNDFAISVNRTTPSVVGYFLWGIWLAGVFLMILWIIRSSLRLHGLKKSALPLQSPEVRRLYHHCLKEVGIHRVIPVYSTAFLKSPMIAGLFKPCIYLPIHLISDYRASDLRYMLLHELQHYRRHDAIANYLAILAGLLYWFNPVVWYALNEMRQDREIACDSSVLDMLSEDAYTDYGNTLLHFAEKISQTPFPFAAGLGGSMKQMKRRIVNIASYKKSTFQKRLKGTAAFILTAVLLLGFSPLLSTYATDKNHYRWNISTENISCTDLSTYFGSYEGSFVLYNLANDTWIIHDMEHATLRVAPDSTYKIYDALFGLDAGVITPENSLLAWNGEACPFEAWQTDQTLRSAMKDSVNWYFQSIDEQLTSAVICRYLRQIGYGNETVNDDLSAYWMESVLKISPVEQVELFIRLQSNSLGFSAEHMNAVKDSIRLVSSDAGTLYGKTGTGRVEGQDVNGWFIGYMETAYNTYFFAVNIEAGHGAAGSNAAEIAMSILSDMGIWK